MLSFLLNIFGRRKASAPAAPEYAVPQLRVELKGRLLELSVKSLVNELHLKTPKGLKYLKESCDK